jgi:hypothetical protein
VNVIVFAAIPDAIPAASGVKVTTYFPALLAVSVTACVPATAPAAAGVTVATVFVEVKGAVAFVALLIAPSATVEVAPVTFVVIDAVIATVSDVAPAV